MAWAAEDSQQMLPRLKPLLPTQDVFFFKCAGFWPAASFPLFVFELLEVF